MIICRERERVIDALDKVLNHSSFRLAPKCSSFLRYVVYQTLDGKADRIKAYTIAVDALGKPWTFDVKSNPSVRVLAYRLRGMLNEYYSEDQHHDVILQMNAGSYIPHFIQSEQRHDKPNLIAAGTR